MKIITIGNVDGKFLELQSKLTAINAKHGPFDLALCVGEFFSADPDVDQSPLVNQTIQLPIPVYFITGKTRMPKALSERASENHGELAQNLIYLGRYGIFTTNTGLSIAFLSGMKHKQDAQYDYYTRSHAESLAKTKFPPGQPPGVDILLTYEWPDSITNECSHPLKASFTSYNVASVAKALCPRYHFSSLEDLFYEREPYKNNMSRATRFIGLASLGNLEKKRWFYAFNIDPMKHVSYETLTSLPSNITDDPFITTTESKKRSHLTEDKSLTYEDYERSYQSKKQKRKKKYSSNDQQCWFCLSNPELATHLIASIGSHVYLTLPKGEFCEHHLLIVPIDHIPSTRAAGLEIQEEIKRYLDAIKTFYKSLNCDVFVWETNFRSQHLNLQVLPIPEDLIVEVKDQILETAKDQQIEFISVDDFDFEKSSDNPYIRIQFPSGEEMIHSTKGRINLLFVREALARVFNCPERIDWKRCALTVEEETANATKFKEMFKDYEKE